MIFLIFSATSFCTDFSFHRCWLILAPVCYQFSCFLVIDFGMIFGGYFYGFLTKNGSPKLTPVGVFSSLCSTLFPEGCLGRFLASFWHPFGSMLVAFGSPLAPFSSLFCSVLVVFWHPSFQSHYTKNVARNSTGSK